MFPEGICRFGVEEACLLERLKCIRIENFSPDVHAADFQGLECVGEARGIRILGDGRDRVLLPLHIVFDCGPVMLDPNPVELRRAEGRMKFAQERIPGFR